MGSTVTLPEVGLINRDVVCPACHKRQMKFVGIKDQRGQMYTDWEGNALTGLLWLVYRCTRAGCKGSHEMPHEMEVVEYG